MYTTGATLEDLAQKEVDVWAEYLDTTRTASSPLNHFAYEEVEPWAWQRLTKHLGKIEKNRRRLERSVA
jgi:hypothetical protein